jgi:hypothetical protein
MTFLLTHVSEDDAKMIDHVYKLQMAGNKVTSTKYTNHWGTSVIEYKIELNSLAAIVKMRQLLERDIILSVKDDKDGISTNSLQIIDGWLD